MKLFPDAEEETKIGTNVVVVAEDSITKVNDKGTITKMIVDMVVVVNKEPIVKVWVLDSTLTKELNTDLAKNIRTPQLGDRKRMRWS